MRLIWPGPAFCLRTQEGLRAGEEAGAGRVTTLDALQNCPFWSMNLGCRSVAVIGGSPSPFVCQDHSEVSIPTLCCHVPCGSIRDILLSLWHSLFSLNR